MRPLPFPVLPLAAAILFHSAWAQTSSADESYTAVLPTTVVEATAESGSTKGYIGYGEAKVSRSNAEIRELPQTIDVINIQKNKNYNTNDLSSILEGNAGIDATYDMRGESIYLRGFNIDANDIYRDGIRESGQVRRSTASVERVEILKGPASVLYGRSGGGGVVNMVSKSANFQTAHNIGLVYGSWADRSANMDFNQKINDHAAVRLIGEIGEANSFRSGIGSKSRMISPSITLKNNNGLSWTAQYIYDHASRIPDRGPDKTEYDKMGISYRTAFARPGDKVEDTLHHFRSDLNWQINPDWSLQWLAGYRRADQNFDHYYGGTYNESTRLLSQTYAWQLTRNQTLSSALTLNGEFNTGPIHHKITAGWDISEEKRHPVLAVLRDQTLNPFNPADWQRLGERPAATTDNHHRAHANGLFIQDLISFTTLKVMLGGRYDQYRFRSTNISNETRSYNGHSFSPNFGVVWDVAPQHTLYASYNKSFSPYGGRSYLGISSSQNEIFNSAPEYGRQYEAGMKSDWLEGRLNTTLAIYRLERYNIRYRPDSINNPYEWRVRGKERSQGVELGAIGQLMPDWYLRGSAGWMSAKIVEDNSDPAAVGRQLSNTAHFNGNVFVRYAPGEKFYGEIGLTRVGERFYYNGNTNIGQTLPGFTRVDMMAGYIHKHWSGTLAVSNLFNKQYWRSSSMPGEPRAFTARLSYRF